MRIGNVGIRREGHEWEVRSYGDHWHIHLGRGLLRMVWAFMTFQRRHGGRS
jgi:hypothetical protein